jgi:type IV secretion system protein VirB11
MSKAHVNFDDVQSSEMLGEYLQPIQALIDDSSLTEVCINRPREVWTEGRAGWQRHDVPELSFSHCRQLATLIASYNGKAISADKPVLSSALPNGERVQVIIPPACEANTVSITIRKPSVLDFTLDELDEQGAFHEIAQIQDGLKPFEHELLKLRGEGRIKDFLDMGVRTQRNILIAGKTGSGKTTVTKSLIRSIPLEERLITIEDVHELFLNQHPNKVHLFYSREDEGGSKVSPKQALASCLRMKPDRILLAELRGDEAWEFIKSVNTGHPGSISTMHANGAFEAFEQLTALIKDSRTGAHLDTDYIQQRLFTTIDIVLFYHQRRLREIYYDPATKLKYLTNAQPKTPEHSLSSSAIPETASQKKLEERFHMAATYMRVLQSSNRIAEQQASVARYAVLENAFAARDSVMARVGGLTNSQLVVDETDKHIVDAILNGQIETLNTVSPHTAPQKPHEPAHKPLEQYRELQA